MGLTWSRLDPLDLLEAVDDGGQVYAWRRRWFALMYRQVHRSRRAVVARDEAGRFVLAIGLYPEEGFDEVWLFAGPALKDRMLAAARDLAELLAGEPGELRAYVPNDGVAGARLARWFGFQDVGVEATPNGPLQVFKRSA